jgi:hypothetical protein
MSRYKFDHKSCEGELAEWQMGNAVAVVRTWKPTFRLQYTFTTQAPKQRLLVSRSHLVAAFAPHTITDGGGNTQPIALAWLTWSGRADYEGPQFWRDEKIVEKRIDHQPTMEDAERLGDGEYYLWNTNEVWVKAKHVGPVHVSYVCPFCWSRHKTDGQPAKNAKRSLHTHGSGGNQDNRVESRSPHCSATVNGGLKQHVHIWIVPSTRRGVVLKS